MRWHRRLRRAFGLLDARTRSRLELSVVAAAVLAVMEAAGLAMVLPLLGEATGGGAGTMTDIPVVGDWTPTSLAALAFALLLTKTLGAALLMWWQLGTLSRSETEMAADLFRRYLNAPWAFHLQRNSAELIRNIQTSVLFFHQLVAQSLVYAATEVLVLGTVVILLFALEPVVAVAAGLFFGLLGLVYQAGVGSRLRNAGRANQDLAAAAQQALQEGLHGYKVIAVSGVASTFVDRFADTRTRWSAARRRIYMGAQLPRYYLETGLLLAMVLLSAVVLLRYDDDEALAVLGLFLAAGFRLLPSLTRIIVAAGNVRTGMAAVDDLHRELDALPDTGPVAAPEPITFERELALEGVHYSYVDGAPVLEGIDLAIAAGSSVGLVGPSGSGKTTTVDVILGLLRPTEGAVVVDARRLTDDDIPSWQRCIGYVPQDVYVLDDSIRRNVALGVPDGEVDVDALAEAIALAQLDAVVAELPEGLDTVVGEHGARLSGGQRQRLGIARALYRRPRLLVLDEATSSLDGETERRLTETIEGLHGRTTLVIVAHRLSTVRACDVLHVIEGGRITSSGRYDEVFPIAPAAGASRDQ